MKDVNKLPDINTMSEGQLRNEVMMWLHVKWSAIPNNVANPSLRRANLHDRTKDMVAGCREEYSSTWSYRIKAWVRKMVRS